MSLGRPRGGFEAAACAAVGDGPALPAPLLLLSPPPQPPPPPATTRSDIDGALLHSSRALDKDDDTRLIAGRGGTFPVEIAAAAAAAEAEGAAECGEAPAEAADEDVGEKAAPPAPAPPPTGDTVSEEIAETVLVVATLNPAVVVIAAIGETARRLPLPALLILFFC